MKSSIKTIAAVLAFMVIVLSCATATALAFLAIQTTSMLLAFLVIPVGATVTFFAAIMLPFILIKD